MASRGKKLSDLKEGDEAIFVCVRDSGEERSVVVIEKVNGNRIHCGAARFDRKTGLPVGSWLGDPSLQCRLQAATKQEIRAVLREHNVEVASRRAATLADRLAGELSISKRKDIANRLRKLTRSALHELAAVFEVEDDGPRVAVAASRHVR